MRRHVSTVCLLGLLSMLGGCTSSTTSSHSVTYKVTGSGGATSSAVTFSTEPDGVDTTMFLATLPYSTTKTFDKGADVYLHAVNDIIGCITVEIDVDGAVFAGPQQSCGIGATATVSGTLH